MFLEESSSMKAFIGMMKLSNWAEERVSRVFKGGGWGESGTLFFLSRLKPWTTERKQRLLAVDVHLSWRNAATPRVRVHICLRHVHLSGWALASYRFGNSQSES